MTFTYSAIDGSLGHLQFLVTVEKASVNIRMHVFCELIQTFLPGYIYRVHYGIAESKGR